MILLSKADWPLKTLKLSGNRMYVEGMEALVQGRWPELAELSLQQCDIDLDAIKVLAQALWHLQRLDLRCNALCDEVALAITELARGKWPDLEELK